MRRVRAFGMVELVVVLALIALLMGILLPVLASARRSSQLTVCASNLRQIGQALASYASERGQWPTVKPAYFDLSHQGIALSAMPAEQARVASAPYLQVALRDYLAADSPVYRCPGDADGRVFDRQRAMTGYGSSYTIWFPLLGYRPGSSPPWNRVMSDFAGVSWSGGSVPDPELHTRPERCNLLTVDGSVGLFGPES